LFKAQQLVDYKEILVKAKIGSGEVTVGNIRQHGGMFR